MRNLHPIMAAALRGVAPAPKIITMHVNPPVPSRAFDWSAYRAGDEPNDAGQMTIGRGATEAEAVADLIRLEDE